MSIFGQKKDIRNMALDCDLYWQNVGSGLDNNVIVKKMENLDCYAGKPEKSHGKNQAAECVK